MYETIVVGVDGSEDSEKALDVGIDIAKRYKSMLIILSVYVNDPFATYMFSSPPPPPPEAVKALNEMLKKYEAMATDKGLKEVTSKIISTYRQAGIGLVKECEDLGCGLLIVGTRGLTGVRRILLGSVAEYVVKNAHCDVHIVRH
jgi:nucleotide-binding universal stress UspA family protein